jgi:uncharacterized protein YuzE
MKGTNFEVDYQYDMAVDGLFIYVSGDYQYDTSIELDNDVILDFNEDGTPVALEILNASHVLKVPKYAINGIKEIKMTIKVNEKSITLKAGFGVILHNMKQTQLVDTFTSNDIGIPSMETELATV